MKNVLIVEDDKSMAQMIQDIVKKIDGDIHTYIASNKEKAYTYAMEINLDLMLVDIVLDTDVSYDVSGIRFAQNIRNVPKYKFVPIIIVTCLEDPKLFSYSEIHCYSYIEKPIDIRKTKKIIEEALEYNNKITKTQKYIYRKGGVFYSVDLDIITYFESYNRVVTMHTINDEVIIPYIPFEKLLEKLGSEDFVQCSRFCILNKNYIEMVDSVNRYVKLKSVSKQIEIGTALKKKFLSEFKNV